jgi:hypothetical protein
MTDNKRSKFIAPGCSVFLVTTSCNRWHRNIFIAKMAISLHFATLLEAITFFTSSAVQAYITKKNTFMESNTESLYCNLKTTFEGRRQSTYFLYNSHHKTQNTQNLTYLFLRILCRRYSSYIFILYWSSKTNTAVS